MNTEDLARSIANTPGLAGKFLDGILADTVRELRVELAAAREQRDRYYQTLNRCMGHDMHKELVRTDKFQLAADKTRQTRAERKRVNQYEEWAAAHPERR